MSNNTPNDLRGPLDRPNVVIFFVDDSGYGDYSHNGNPTIATPTISRMANEGANFTQFYVTSPACTASRYSLLTGRLPARSGLGTWVVSPNSSRYLHPQEITIAEALREQGYATGIFGKWHLGNPNKKNGFTGASWPLAHGFDTWLGTNVSHDYANAMLVKSDPLGKFPTAGYRVLAERLRSDEPATKSLTARYTDATINFIRENHDRPFFAYIPHNQPHLGLACGDEFRGQSRRGLLGDVMAELDHSVARVLESLKTFGVAKNTLVIFASDNGPWVRFQDTASHPSYGEARLNVGYAMPFRDGKGSTWEGGHRVPGVFYWPGTIAPNTVMNPASTLDILPTIMKLTGVELPKDRQLDGRDIRPLMDARWQVETQVLPFEMIYSSADNAASAYRFGPWKVHLRLHSQTGNNYGFEASRSNPLLFQVEHDLGERFDRASENPRVVRDLLDRLARKEQSIKTAGTYWDD